MTSDKPTYFEILHLIADNAYQKDLCNLHTFYWISEEPSCFGGLSQFSRYIFNPVIIFPWSVLIIPLI